LAASRYGVFLGACLGVLAAALIAGWLASSMIAGIVTGVLLGALLVWYFLLRPLHAVRREAESIAGGNFTARVWPVPRGPAEQLVRAFNNMAEHVDARIAQASHERSRLAAAMNSSIDAVAALDREGRILFANLGFERAFGRPAEDVVGEPFAWVLADEQVLDAVRASRDQGLRQIATVERPGRQFFQVTTTPIASGGEWSVLAVCHDVTDVKRTDQIRRDFIANVSHELRTPLASIKSVVETLAEGALQDEEVAQEFLRRADYEVDRLVLLVEELLELSRIESGEQPLSRTQTDIGCLLQEVVERLRPQAEREQIDLRLDCVPELGAVEVDPARIELAVLNLVHNALKFTSAAGTVTVSAARQPGQIVVEVSDTGVGIAASELPRIFERFYKVDQSRASKGSGLGLALVKHAVEAHGGSVSVRSQPGKGSVFSFMLPVSP
jgi:two-component system, OmpR family, phosphate regulon sensor histidine kinase PhoR